MKHKYTIPKIPLHLLYTFFPLRTHSYLEQSHTVAAQQREARWSKHENLILIHL